MNDPYAWAGYFVIAAFLLLVAIAAGVIVLLLGAL